MVLNKSVISGKEKSFFRKSLSFLEIVLYLILWVIFLKFFILDFYLVAGNSMFPTLNKGDRILISRVNYSFGMPSEYFNGMEFKYKNIRNNDVIIFDNYAAYRSNKFIVKRVIAQSGDSLHIMFTSNGPEYSHLDIYNDFNFKIPAKGTTVKLNRNNLKFYKKLLIEEKNKIETEKNKIFINGNELDEYTFKNNYYFVTGDNYTNSMDSRHYGLVPESAVIGKPLLILSSNEPGYSFKWIY